MYPFGYPYLYFGMHAAWWVFWFVLLIVLVGVCVPVPRTRWRSYRASAPLEVLKRRYAAGEITTEDYEQRRKILERDEPTAGRHELDGTHYTNPRGV